MCIICVDMYKLFVNIYFMVVYIVIYDSIRKSILDFYFLFNREKLINNGFN